jgi:hypothetical protein
MNYHFEEHALQELRDAIAYYEAVDLGLGNRFRAAVLSAISLIRQFPNAWPQLRRAVAGRSNFRTGSFTASRTTRSKSWQ